ncbi:MAG: preprotein translocase subunit SecE [Verrucomicrobiales bacterium]|jgi:preprotein translocase subunit SecE
MFGRMGKFVGEVKTELQKATWPWDPKEKGVKKYKELIDSTIVVLIAMILLGGYVAFGDFVMVNTLRFLTSAGTGE